MPAHLDLKEKSEIIELITDPSLQNFFMKEELSDFWPRRRSTHPLLSYRTLKFIVTFIVKMLYVKNKHRTRINDKLLFLRVSKVF